MSELDKLLQGEPYPNSGLLSEMEIEKLCKEANELLCNMNGDTNVIELTVRQFHILLHSAIYGSPLWEIE